MKRITVIEISYKKRMEKSRLFNPLVHSVCFLQLNLTISFRKSIKLDWQNVASEEKLWKMYMNLFLTIK